MKTLFLLLATTLFATEPIVQLRTLRGPRDTNSINNNFRTQASDLRLQDSRIALLEAVQTIPSGLVAPIASETAPTGWLECDGVAVSRSEFSELFNVIGTAYGNGDGSTTFNLPDFRGRFLRGWDHGAGNDPDAGGRTVSASGGVTGDNVGSLQDDEFEAHIHQSPGNSQGADIGGGGGNFGFALAADKATTSTGGLETRPKNIFVMWIIKT